MRITPTFRSEVWEAEVPESSGLEALPEVEPELPQLASRPTVMVAARIRASFFFIFIPPVVVRICMEHFLPKRSLPLFVPYCIPRFLKKR